MMHKLLGAAMILLGCGGFGFSMAARHRRDVRCLQIFLASLDYLECELEYRLTPLPDLCRKVVRICPGAVGKVYDRLASELEGQAVPTVEPCFRQALLSDRELPPNTRAVMEQLGQTLGAFDLSGQLRGIQLAAVQFFHSFLVIESVIPAGIAWLDMQIGRIVQKK